MIEIEIYKHVFLTIDCGSLHLNKNVLHDTYLVQYGFIIKFYN